MAADSNFIPTELLESLRILLRSPDLQIWADPEWGSHHPRHRELLHQQRDFLLQNLPEFQTSIAHTQGLGILVLSKHAIGVDVEVVERVSAKVIARISSPEELQAAPSAASLWTAKEAAFKALRPYKQPSVLSDISIGGWTKIDSQTETFCLNHYSRHQVPSVGMGVCTLLAPYRISFFVIPS